jgi:hypothetical protein
MGRALLILVLGGIVMWLAVTGRAANVWNAITTGATSSSK